MVIDFHSHLLPGIDDGSKDADMSIEMLRESRRQGIDICVATPHFYGNRVSIEEFLKARSRAREDLSRALAGKEYDVPEVYIGAEVAWFNGIARAGGLDQLTMQGTDLLLLEMPYCPWDDTIFDEAAALTKRFHVVFAHLERFLDFRQNTGYVRDICDMKADVQVNAESLLHWRAAHRVRKYFNGRFILGSDMHNMDKRPPLLSKAREKISSEDLGRMDSYTEHILRRAKQ